MISKSFHAIWIGALAVVVVGGCSREAPTGEVSGKITFRDQPVAFGTVSFTNQEGKAASGPIENGVYKVVKVPVGATKIIAIATPDLRPVGMPPPGQAPSAAGASEKKPFVPIPDRYQDKEKSDLSYTVVAGPQTHDIAMKP